MKRSIKPATSRVITVPLNYKVKGNNKPLAEELKTEQKGFCAYTEKQFSSTDLYEIDHFDPTLKGQAGDNYKNWYLVVAKWNRKKSKKWLNFQPVLHPTSADFATRVWFQNGIYQYNSNDAEAKNLIALLDLNNYELTRERDKFIDRMIALRNSMGEDEFREHLTNHPEQIHFPSAFEATFGFGFIFN